jgi:hypothetical protein
MKHAGLLSTVAATLLLATVARAQTGDVAPAPAPPALQNAPAEKLAPNMKAGKKDAETHKPMANGQGAPKSLAPGHGENIEQGTGIKNSYDTGATTGQGAAAASASLSAEQRSKITRVLKQKRVEPAHLTVSVNVGTRIPESVQVYPLPGEVVEVYPAWHGYDYLMAGDRILIIDPDTHQVVAILEA